MKNRKISLYIFAFIIFINCNKEESIKTHNTTINNQDLIVLGQKLQNPFSLENMRKAYNELNFSNIEDEDPIEVSHYYIRYLPNSEVQLDMLKNDSTLDLYTFPLDYEIEEDGVYYHDPSIPAEEITWQYTVVKEDYSFQDIQHEILEELYLPEDDENSEETENILFNQKLIKKAFSITSNILQINSDNQIEGLLPSKWRPEGYINVWDDVAEKNIPLQGAKVRARWWFNISSTYTAPNGHYRLSQFRYPVNYSIKWETVQYDIRTNFGYQALYNGRRLKGDWNLNITGGKHLGFATVHRGAYRYHYKNRGGLQSPKPHFRLNIKYVHKDGTGVNFGNNWNLSFFNNIKIWGLNSDLSRQTTDEIFSTTIHELAHSSHIKKRNMAFPIVTERIRESWANAVEWYITKIEYDELGYPNFDDPNDVDYYYSDNQQAWRNAKYRSDFSSLTAGEKETIKNYTPLFKDLVDNFNQSLKRGVSPANRCPNGGGFDGENCYVGSPPNGTAFIRTNAFFYTGPTCNTSMSWPDGGDCYVQMIPNGSIGFIWANSWYLKPAGNITYPYDEVQGYTMPQLEGMLQHFNGLSSTHEKLKLHKPVGILDKHLDFYFNYYYSY